jgi:hypothetical protein
MKQTAELVKKCQERMKSIRDKNYFTLRFGKTKMYSEKPFKKINMKQTAVEWLVEQVVNRTDRMYFLKEFEQAKEMEKEQIENAYNVGNPYKTAEQYYNQTFKSE